MKKAMTKKYLAHELRELARGAERIEQGEESGYVGQSAYTCNAINHRIAGDTGRRYTDVFEIYSASNAENHIWRQPDGPSIRVLLLCFAAAMAETGDL